MFFWATLGNSGVICLGIFHLFLICIGRTTKEERLFTVPCTVVDSSSASWQVLTGKITVAGRTLLHERGASLIHARSSVRGSTRCTLNADVYPILVWGLMNFRLLCSWVHLAFDSVILKLTTMPTTRPWTR